MAGFWFLCWPAAWLIGLFFFHWLVGWGEFGGMETLNINRGLSLLTGFECPL